MSSDPDPRTRILEAAETLFADRGFAATSVRELAGRAGVNVAMIHYYFGSKAGLYRSLFEFEVGRVRSLLESAAGLEGTARERIASFIRAYTRFLTSHPSVARILQRELLNDSGVLREIVRPQIARNHTILSGIIRDGIESREFRDLDAELAPVSLVGMMAFFVIVRPIVSGFLGDDIGDDAFAERLAEHTIALFLNGVSSPSAPAPEDFAPETVLHHD